MFSETIELRGHIIDSLILPKVLDEILKGGGNFKIAQVKIGQSAPIKVLRGLKCRRNRVMRSMI